MLSKARRSFIASTLLLFFIFSIACCLPVGMAEDSIPGGEGDATLAIQVSSPEQGAQITDTTLHVTGTVAGQPAWFKAEVWNYDNNNVPVQISDIGVADITDGSFDFTVELSTLNTDAIDFTLPGEYELCLWAGLEGDQEGIFTPVTYSIISQQSNTPNQINLTPNLINIGDSLAFQFNLSGVTLQNSPYAIITQPSAEPGGQPTLIRTPVEVNQPETGGYQASFSNIINVAGSYNLVIFDGQPSPTNNTAPVVAYGTFEVQSPDTGVQIIQLIPGSLTTGEQVSLSFTIPDSVPAADTRYAVLVQDTPDHPSVNGAGVATVIMQPDGLWHATWPTEVQLTSGNYIMALFNAPPAPGMSAVAFGNFSVTPASFQFATTELPQADLTQPYQTTIEVANGTAPYTWQLSILPSMTLPAGVTLIPVDGDTSKAVLSFTPEKCAIIPVEIIVTDSVDNSITKIFTINVVPPLFEITPNQVYAGDLLNFEFTLPEGISVNEPWAVLVRPDMSFFGPSVPVIENTGKHRVSWYPGLLEDYPSGTYGVAVYEGQPDYQKNPVAAGLFELKSLPHVEANPNPITLPHPADQNVSLHEIQGGLDVWEDDEVLSIEINKQQWNPEQNMFTVTNIASLSGAQLEVLENCINFTLPASVTEGYYQLRVYRDQLPIAKSSLQLQYPNFSVTPNWVPSYYRQSPVIELSQIGSFPKIWSPFDTLEVRLTTWNPDKGATADQPVLVATIPNRDLYNEGDIIKFNLPANVDMSFYNVELFREDQMIARGYVNVRAEWFETEPHRILTDAQDKTITLSEYNPETWYANEASQLKLDFYKKNYDGFSGGFAFAAAGVPVASGGSGGPGGPGGPGGYSTAYVTSIDSASLSVSNNEITFTLPDEVSTAGDYELRLLRQIDATNWRTVGMGDLSYTLPPIQLPITGTVFSGDPPSFKEGYSLPFSFTLTDEAGTAWSANDDLFLNLYKFNPVENSWRLVPGPFEVVVDENTISGKLPLGLWAGDYTVTVSHASYFTSDDFAFGQFEILPALELSSTELPAAILSEPYEAFLNVTDGQAPFTWNILPSPIPGAQLPAGLNYYPNENDSSQLIISGIFTQAGVYPMVIQIMDGNGKLSFHNTKLFVREGMPRVKVGKTGGLPGREVVVPINGENLMGTGVSGIQFTLDYDPALATIVTDGVSPGTILDTSIVSNIDNVNGHADVTIAWTHPLNDVDFAELCKVTFQLNSNPPIQTCTIGLQGLEGMTLSDGQNDIPADVFAGEIRVAKYGDVNVNGKVDVGDAVLMLRQSAGLINLPHALIEVANVDGSTDGVVGPADAMLVLKRVVRLIDKFSMEP